MTDPFDALACPPERHEPRTELPPRLRARVSMPSISTTRHPATIDLPERKRTMSHRHSPTIADTSPRTSPCPTATPP